MPQVGQVYGFAYAEFFRLFFLWETKEMIRQTLAHTQQQLFPDESCKGENNKTRIYDVYYEMGGKPPTTTR